MMENKETFEQANFPQETVILSCVSAVLILQHSGFKAMWTTIDYWCNGSSWLAPFWRMINVFSSVTLAMTLWLS